MLDSCPEEGFKSRFTRSSFVLGPRYRHFSWHTAGSTLFLSNDLSLPSFGIFSFHVYSMSIYYTVADRSSTLSIIKAFAQQPCRIYYPAVRYRRDHGASCDLARPEYPCSIEFLTPFLIFLIMLHVLLDAAIATQHNLGTPRTGDREAGAVKNLLLVRLFSGRP